MKYHHQPKLLLTIVLLILFNGIIIADVCAQDRDIESTPVDVQEQQYDNDYVDSVNQNFLPTAEDISEDETSNGENGYIDDDNYSDGYEDESRFSDDTELKLPNPVYEITQIHISGNHQTSRERILSMMNIHPGDQSTLDELEESRIRLALSGAFESVVMRLIPGKTNSRLEISLTVVERSKIQINSIWLGTSDKSPFWAGLDVTWLAPFSLPHRLRLAYGATTTNDYTLRLSYQIPSIFQSPVSVSGSIFSTVGHEGLYGNQHTHFMQLGDLNYRRDGLSVGVDFSLAESVRLMIRAEYSYVTKDTTDDKYDVATHEYLANSHSHLPTLSAMVSYDNRPGRDLPNQGHIILFGLRGTIKSAMSNYQYIRVNLFHQSNFQIQPKHIFRIQTFGGLIYGDTPFFEKYFYNDFYTFSPARFHGLNSSNRGALDLFRTGSSSLSYEDFLVNLALTYAWQPMPKMELFISAAATYADSFEKPRLNLGIQPNRPRDSFPVDLSFNAGVRFRTEYGLIDLTLAQILNLLPRSK